MNLTTISLYVSLTNAKQTGKLISACLANARLYIKATDYLSITYLQATEKKNASLPLMVCHCRHILPFFKQLFSLQSLPCLSLCHIATCLPWCDTT